MPALCLRIERDSYVPSPLFATPWRIVSFRTEHSTHEAWGDYFERDEDYGHAVPRHESLRDDLLQAKAFRLDWWPNPEPGHWWPAMTTAHAPAGYEPEAGLLFWDEAPSALASDPVYRCEAAAALLNRYVAWQRGEVYRYTLEDLEGTVVDERGEIVGDSTLKRVLENSVRPTIHCYAGACGARDLIRIAPEGFRYWATPGDPPLPADTLYLAVGVSPELAFDMETFPFGLHIDTPNDW